MKTAASTGTIAHETGLASLALTDQLESLTIPVSPEPPPKPTYEEIEQAFKRWENLLWSGVSSDKVRRAEQTYNKLVNAFLGISTV